MTMTAVIGAPVADARAWSSARHIAHVEVFHDLHEAEPVWRSL
jgi:hypothetical protein